MVASGRGPQHFRLHNESNLRNQNQAGRGGCGGENLDSALPELRAKLEKRLARIHGKVEESTEQKNIEKVEQVPGCVAEEVSEEESSNADAEPLEYAMLSNHAELKELVARSMSEAIEDAILKADKYDIAETPDTQEEDEEASLGAEDTDERLEQLPSPEQHFPRRALVPLLLLLLLLAGLGAVSTTPQGRQAWQSGSTSSRSAWLAGQLPGCQAWQK